MVAGQPYYSVEQVARLLGLHVRTVRGYVRDGKLRAIRVGRQYRIAREDLTEFTGLPAPDPARRRRHAEMSGVAQIDAIGPDASGRLVNLLMAAARSRHGTPGGTVGSDTPTLRVETLYDEEREVLKVILLGDLSAAADVLSLIDSVVADL